MHSSLYAKIDCGQNKMMTTLITVSSSENPESLNDPISDTVILPNQLMAPTGILTRKLVA